MSSDEKQKRQKGQKTHSCGGNRRERSSNPENVSADHPGDSDYESILILSDSAKITLQQKQKTQ